MVVFNVIRVHIVIKVGVAKHSWVLWPRPLPQCPYEAFSKVGDYGLGQSRLNPDWWEFTLKVNLKAETIVCAN